MSVQELFRAHGDQVARWAGRLAGPTIEAEDIVQEVFLIAHRQLADFRGESKITSWLFGITHNVVRHRRRRERLRRMFLLTAQNEAHTVPARPTPVEALERREATDVVYRALDRLSEKYRSVFILFEIEGLSGGEVCELTGLNPSTLRVNLMRARAQFQKALKALGHGGRTE